MRGSAPVHSRKPHRGAGSARPRPLLAAVVFACTLYRGDLAHAQTPTVSGPESAGTAVELQLPGPSTRPLKDALEFHFEGECLTAVGLVRAVARNWTASDRLDRRVSVFVAGEEKPSLWARYSVKVDDEPAWSSDNAREFSGIRDCARLEEILGLSLAMAIEQVPPPKPIKPKPKLPKRPPPPARPLPLPGGTLGAHVIGAVGVLPTGAVGFGVRGEHSIDQFAARIGAGYLVAGSALSDEGMLAPGMVTSQLGACYGSLGGNAIGKMCVDAWFGMMLPNADAQTQGMWLALAPGAEVGFRSKSGMAIRVGTQLSFNFVRVHSDASYDSMNLLSDRQGAAVLGWLLSLGIDWQL